MSGYYTKLREQHEALIKMSSISGKVGKETAAAGGKLFGAVKNLLMGKAQKTGPYARKAEEVATRLGGKAKYPRRVPQDPATSAKGWKKVTEKEWQAMKKGDVLPGSHFEKRTGPSGSTSFYVRARAFSPKSVLGFAERNPGLTAGTALGGWMVAEPAKRRYQELKGKIPSTQEQYYPPGTY